MRRQRRRADLAAGRATRARDIQQALHRRAGRLFPSLAMAPTARSVDAAALAAEVIRLGALGRRHPG